MTPADAAPIHLEGKPSPPPAQRPSRFTLRVGAGVGGGSEGIGASAFGTGDLWLWSRWSLGVEGSLGGSSSMALFGPTRTSSLIAARVRFAGRLVLARGSYFSAAVALGVAQEVTVHESESDADCGLSFEDDCYNFQPPAPADPGPGPYREAMVPTGALELAYQGRIAGPVELGVVLRGEGAPDALFVTFGPVLGAGF